MMPTMVAGKEPTTAARRAVAVLEVMGRSHGLVLATTEATATLLSAGTAGLTKQETLIILTTSVVIKTPIESAIIAPYKQAAVH